MKFYLSVFYISMYIAGTLADDVCGSNSFPAIYKPASQVFVPYGMCLD